MIFEQRAKALIDEFKVSETPRFLMADSKLYWAQHKACFVLGTNIEDNVLTDLEVFQGDKSQSHMESEFRFLKDPLFLFPPCF